MKLWQITQWGNPKEGPNGWDTSVIVRATSFDSALAVGETFFTSFPKTEDGKPYREGEANLVVLMGDDFSKLAEEKIVIHDFVLPAFNLGHYQSWKKDCVFKDGKITGYEWFENPMKEA
jgi:hypothetical protein